MESVATATRHPADRRGPRHARPRDLRGDRGISQPAARRRDAASDRRRPITPSCGSRIAAALIGAVGSTSAQARRGRGRRHPRGDESAHQPGGQAGVEATAARMRRRCRSSGGPDGCRRRTRCRRATRRAQRRSPSASGWRARRSVSAWPCWPGWSGYPGWRRARTTPVTCWPASGRAQRIAVARRTDRARRSSRRACPPPIRCAWRRRGGPTARASCSSSTRLRAAARVPGSSTRCSESLPNAEIVELER